MWVGGWSCDSLDDTSPSDDVIAPLAQVYLLGRGTGQLNFRNGWLACGDGHSAAFGRLLCKNRLRFLPLHTATVVRCVVSPAATALGLLPQGRLSTGQVIARTSDAPWCVSAVTLRVAEALAAFPLQRAVWSHLRFHRHSQAQSSVSFGTFDISGPRAIDTMKCGWDGRLWRGPDRDGRIAAA